jgi:hypothetical protein
MNVRSIRRPAIGLASALTLSCGLAWSGTGLAATSCLKGGSTNKLCLDLSSIPGDVVQPSELAGTKTYVKYTATLRNVVAATSRNVTMDLSFSPAPPSAISVATDSGVACAAPTATGVSCTVDKLGYLDPLTVVVVVEAPQYPTTVTQMLATGTYGWNGNTSTTSQSVAVSDTGGRSYVPANTEVTLVTEPEASDPSTQTSVGDPLFGKVTLPPRPTAYFAQISVIGGPAVTNCTGGFFLSATDGGPYACRNAGNRWVQFDAGSTPGSDAPVVFDAAAPMHFSMIWDASLVPATQLPPTPLTPTGTPAFAVFYSHNDTPPPAAVAVRAFSQNCSATANVPPCLIAVTHFDNNAWRAEGLKVTDGTDEIALAGSPVEKLYAMLNFFLPTAQGLPIKPPIMQ